MWFPNRGEGGPGGGSPIWEKIFFLLKTFLKFLYCLTPRITFLFHCSRIFQNGRKLEKTFFVKSVHKGCNDDGDDYGDKDDNDCDNDDCDDGDGYD